MSKRLVKNVPGAQAKNRFIGKQIQSQLPRAIRTDILKSTVQPYQLTIKILENNK